ncbi:hypothetical protein IAI10_05105 [Clostridium sp. 19966]|uniref:hypothetical protein n=1 Tax=Clostridium sp. 19966 TaxID=2768166 RepID=UPI0028DFE0C4|nr:hypothetical protein [Clostridium sp. 19966]MDT8716023.1 hypothetical protein [Clostridium sp. 19966]
MRNKKQENEKKEGKVGRKRTFTTEELNYVIKMYISTKKYITKLSGKHMAEFAQRYLVEQNSKYENIQGYHFNRNQEIKQAIKDYETQTSTIKLTGKKDTRTMVRFNIDAFFKLTKGDENSQRKILQSFNSNYEKTYRDLAKVDKKVEELEIQYRKDIAEKDEEIVALKKRNIELSTDNRKINMKIANLNRLDRFIEQLDIYEYLRSKGMVGELDLENLELLLSRAGLIKIKDVYNDIEPEVLELKELSIAVDDDINNDVEMEEKYEYTDFVNEAIDVIEEDDMEARAFAFMDKFSSKNK